MLRNKKAKMGGAMVFVVIIAIAALVIGLMNLTGSPTPSQQAATKEQVKETVVEVVKETTGLSGKLVDCGSNHLTSTVVNMRNGLNKTGSETFDTTIYFTATDGSDAQSFSDTTSPTAVNFVCDKTSPKTYVGKVLSTSGVSGDSSFITGIDKGDGTQVTQLEENGVVYAKVTSDGNVEYTPTGSAKILNLVSEQHSLVECRSRDMLNDGYLFNISGTSAQAYTNSPGSFNSTVSGTATTALGDGGAFKFRLECQPHNDLTDVNLNDRGINYVLNNTATVFDNTLINLKWSIGGDSWKDATKIKGGAASGMTLAEDSAYANLEAVWRIPENEGGKHLVFDSNHELWMLLEGNAKTGQNPGATDNLDVSLETGGCFLSTGGTNLVKCGVRQDDVSNTVVHTAQIYTYDLS